MDKEAKSNEPIPLDVKDTSTVAIWQFYSPIHLYSAYILAMKALEIENSYSTGTAPQGVIDEHSAYVTGAIFASVAFLEALINEIFLIAEKYVGGTLLDDIIKPLQRPVVESMAQIWGAKVKKGGSDVAEMDKNNKKIVIKTHRNLVNYLSLNQKKEVAKSVERNWFILNKFQLALYLADGAIHQKTFNKQLPPWTEVYLLIRLRDHLVHYKPEFVTFPSSSDGPYEAETDETIRLMEALKTRPCNNRLNPGKGALTEGALDHRLGANCAMWAVDSSLQFVSEFSRRMPLVLYGSIRKLALKRCVYMVGS